MGNLIWGALWETDIKFVLSEKYKNIYMKYKYIPSTYKTICFWQRKNDKKNRLAKNPKI